MRALWSVCISLLERPEVKPSPYKSGPEFVDFVVFFNTKSMLSEGFITRKDEKRVALSVFDEQKLPY